MYSSFLTTLYELSPFPSGRSPSKRRSPSGGSHSSTSRFPKVFPEQTHDTTGRQNEKETNEQKEEKAEESNAGGTDTDVDEEYNVEGGGLRRRSGVRRERAGLEKRYSVYRRAAFIRDMGLDMAPFCVISLQPRCIASLFCSLVAFSPPGRGEHGGEKENSARRSL